MMICFIEFMFQVLKQSYLTVLKISNNLKKHKKLIRRRIKKGLKKMEKNVVELGTCHLVFTK
jgi:hypothetical protein